MNKRSLTLRRCTATDRGAAILSRLSRRKHAQRRSRWLKEVMRRLRNLPEEDVQQVLAVGNAMIDAQRGLLDADTRAGLKALTSAQPQDLDAIAAWLIEHGYLTVAE